jgi:hypothetical protein
METEPDNRTTHIMRRKLAAAPIYLSAVLISGSISSPVAQAGQPATATDLMDCITRMGGWFLETNVNGQPIAVKDRDRSVQYWAQVSYVVTPPATNSNLTTIKMTRYDQEREDTKGVCSTENMTTDTVLIDLRELQISKVTLTPPPDPKDKDKDKNKNEDKVKVWKVNLVMNDGRPIIRKVTTVTPPTIVGFSAASSAPGIGTAATCPGLRYGQDIKATTDQADVNTYAIEFANPDEAKYLLMLIQSQGSSLNPPRSKTASSAP